MTIEEYFKNHEAKKERFKTIPINNKDDILNFIKNELKAGYEEVEDGKFKGSIHCNWTITFTKGGKLVMNARSVRKSFWVENGLDIYDIFAGFEII